MKINNRKRIIIYIIIILGIALLLTGCKKDAQSTHKEGDYDVEFLFEHDGCKVYRFTDGRTVYFSDCRGKIEHEVKNKNHTNHYETLNN